MANPFDQFDTPRERPAAPVAPAQSLIPQVNPFDRFDRAPTQSAMKEDTLGQFGAGIVTGVPNAVTGTADLMEKGIVDTLLFQNPATGRNQLQTVIEAWGDVFSGKDPQAEAAKRAESSKPYKPVSGDAVRKGMSFLRINPNDYFAEPRTAGERIARMAGEGAVTSLTPLPGAQQTGWAKLAEIGKNIIAGTVGGAAAQGAMELAPDEWDPLVGVVGGLAGGVAGYYGTAIPGAVAKGVGKGVDYLRPAIQTQGNIERLAAERVAGAATDPAAAAKAIGEAPELVPGSKPTSFQASGDVGLGSLERALARGDDKFKAALIDRVEQQNAARVHALDAIEESGDIGAAVQFFRDRMRTLEEHADTLYDRSERSARGEYDALGDRSAADIGEAARSAIAARFKDMNAEASKLWKSIDPDGTLNVETAPVVNEAAKIYGAMSPEEALTLSAAEKNLANIIGTYGDTLPFSRFKELRSAITTGMRDAKSFANPNDQAHRRLSALRTAIEAAVENSVMGKFARDASLAEEFVREARDWYAARTNRAAAPAAETGAGAPAGAMGAATESPDAVPPGDGEASAPVSEPRAAEGGEGLPQYAGAELEASSPAPIAARENYPIDEGTIQSLDPREIGVDARRFQFKEGGDDQGVTERLQGIEKWDPRLAGTALVFRDAQGKDWVADGHQRTGLARRLMEAGHPPIRINAFVLDAANGFTDAEARAIAAIKNVAEGTGTPVDAAKVMRAAKETGIELPPLPPRSALVRDGKALAELSPDAFGMVINDVVPAAYGAIVGRMVKDPLQQEEALRLISTLKPDNARQVEMVVRDMLSSGTEQMTRQGGLFGEEAFASSVTLERAKIADQALQLLKQDKKLFATLVNQADSIEGGGNKLARDANETRLSTDEKASDLLQKLAFRAGPVSDELSRLARDLKAGRTPANAAARDFLGAVRRQVESGLDAGDGTGGAGARAVGDEAEVTSRDTDTAEMFEPAPPVGSGAFNRWFGDSKVVDENGAPLVVYHGTNKAGFEVFDTNPTGEVASTSTAGTGAWFTPDKAYAASYQWRDGDAEIVEVIDLLADAMRGIPARAKHYPVEYRAVEKDGAYFVETKHDGFKPWLSDPKTRDEAEKYIRDQLKSGGKNEGTYAVFLRMEKPHVIDWGGENWHKGPVKDKEGYSYSTNAYVRDNKEALIAAGYDGVILKNVDGQGSRKGDTKIADEYVVFEPTQIKSVDNRGTFDPNDPRILHQSKPAPWREGEMFGGFETERGLEGLPQTVIPGVKPVTDADRIGARADRPLKGGDAPPPKGGLFDTESREFQERQGSLFQGEPGGIRDTMAERFAAAGRPAEEAVAAAELIDAFYSTMAQRLGKSVDDLVAEHPLPTVQRGGTGNPQGSMFQRRPEEKNLYAVHNIKPGGVLNATKLGGLPMPSLAIARIDKGDFSNFGDISLVGSPRLVDPKGGRGAKTYDADVYSPRYPSVSHDIDTKAFNELNRPIVAGVKELGGREYDGIDVNRLEDRGPAEAIDSTGLKYAYLKEKGIPVFVHKGADGPNWSQNRDEVDHHINAGRRADYEEWAENKLKPLVKRERIFKGFDYNGNRRYREHNMDNVLSDMRARLKEGEGFMYGVGTIRSKHAKKFGSLPAIGKERDRIVGVGGMDKGKDAFSDRFFDLVDEMRPFYRFQADSFQYPDDVAGMFGEIATKGYRALDEGFKDLPDDLRGKVRTFLTDLANAPTEYFETKINRAVGLDEFEAALVPTGTQPRVIEALKKAGLRVVEFDKKKEGARTEAIRQLNAERPDDDNLLFQPAYHGSPHIFDKFSSDAIGTGEGHQAFGHGLYFAGKKEVAQFYREALAGRSDPHEWINEYVQQFKDGELNPADATPSSVRFDLERQDLPIAQAILDTPGAPEAIAKVINGIEAGGTVSDEGIRAYRSLDKMLPKPPNGRLYKVDIPGDDEMMSWDQPIRDMSPNVKEAINKVGREFIDDEPMVNGETLGAWEIKRYADTPEVGSEFIRQALLETRSIPAAIKKFRAEMSPYVVHHSKRMLEGLEDAEVRFDKFDIDGPHGTLTGEQFYNSLMDHIGRRNHKPGTDRYKFGDPVAASNALREAGIPGHRFLDQGSRNRWRVTQMEDGRWTGENPATGESKDFSSREEARAFVDGQNKKHSTHNYVIYDDSKVDITGYEQRKGGDPRGRIQFDPTGNVISLFDSADASTALHEAGHHFLDMYKQFAAGPDAGPIAADWRATKAWWDKNAQAVAKDAGEGVTAADVRRALRGEGTGNKAKDRAIDRGFHEQWARGFERYLMEGKAPNSALKAIFQQFKDWLTQVYRSALGLNVNISPEVRGVFDRMLATEQPAAKMPRMMDRPAAARFSSATAATRELKETFGAKPVKGILKRPGPTYPYDMSAEGVASNLFKAGPEGSNFIKAARRAGAQDADIEAAAVASLKRAATKDGTLDPAKLTAWRQKHSDALRELPALDRRLTSAADATRAMADIGERRRNVIDQVQRSAVGRLLKIGDDGDAPTVLGRMLGRDSAVKDMRALAKEAAGDPNAIAGLRRAIVDQMIGRLKTPKDALRSDTFQRYLGKNAPALSQVLSPEQMNSLRAIAQDLKRASKDVRAPGGGSDTAENLAARGRYGVGEQPSLLGALLRNAAVGVLAGAPAHIIATILGGPIGAAISSIVSGSGNTLLQHFRQIGINKVDDLVRRAILDPELMRVLLMKAPKKKDSGSVVPLGQALTQLAINDMLINVGDREENWKGRGQQRPAPADGKFTETLAVRG